MEQAHKEQVYKQAELLKALANPIRLCLLQQLIEKGETSVNEITACMDVSQSAISQHLRRLKDLNLVTSRKENNYIYYACPRMDLRKIIKILEESEQ